MSTEDHLHSQILLRIRDWLLNSSFELPSKISRAYTTDTSIQNRWEAKYKHDYDKKYLLIHLNKDFGHTLPSYCTASFPVRFDREHRNNEKNQLDKDVKHKLTKSYCPKQNKNKLGQHSTESNIL